MLKVLAKQVSDCVLPEALYDNMTFRRADDTERSVESEVEVSAIPRSHPNGAHQSTSR